MSNHDNLTYVADVAFEDDPAKIACSCGSCDWRGFASQLDPIEQAILTPGDPSPAGRCPVADCGALAYVDEPKGTQAAPFKTPVRLERHGGDAAGPIFALVAADSELITVLQDATPAEAEAIVRLMNAGGAVANTSPVGG